MTTLNVYWDAECVGRLERSGRRDLLFRYDAAYLESEEPRAVSWSLPLQASPHGDDVAQPWFANLLPEGEIRGQIARELGLSERNTFDLLARLGGDCAGALQLLPGDVPVPGAGRTTPLPWDELEGRIAAAPRPSLQALAVREGDLRLSLAGAQDKLPVCYENGRLSLPVDGTPSTHLLKIESGGLPGLVRNELFCMTLARAVGLPVPRVELAPTSSPVLLVERYDRERTPQGDVVRLHQEDFCQALGLPPDMKYENEGGPSLALLFETLSRASIAPLPDRRELLRWVLFNVLIGNADAHAKNLSLLIGRRHDTDGPRLAPFYDLVCTAAYHALSRKAAQKIGGEYRTGALSSRHWNRFAATLGIKDAYLRSLGLELCDRVEAAAESAAEQIGGAPDVVRRTVAERTRRLRHALSDPSPRP